MDFDVSLRMRAKKEDCTIPTGFEDRLDSVLAALPDGETSKRTARPLRTLLLAAAVCAALCLTAVALSPTLREALSDLLGTFEPYSSEVEGISVIDNGIRVRVLSTLADQNDGVAYLEVTDLTGDRLDENTSYTATGAGQCTAYDVDKHMALFKYGMGKQERTENGMATISISHFMVGLKRFEEVKLPQDVITDQRLESMTTAESPEHLVLQPNQTPVKLETEDFSISSIGFDRAGVFHIQLKMADGVKPVDPDAIYPYDFEINWEWTSLNEIHTVFEDEKYVDIAFPDLTIDHFGQFKMNSLRGCYYTGGKIEGNWELTFPLEILPERTVTTEETLYQTRLASFRISAMSVRLEAIYDGPEVRSYFGNFPLTLVLKDGAVVHLEYENYAGLYRTAAGTLTDDRCCGAVYLWTSAQAVDPKNVVGVALGQRYIPLQGDTAGEGSWLPEVP